MKNFGAYVRELEQLTHAATAHRADKESLSNAIGAALDGQPGEQLRRLVDLDARRKDGAFFSGSTLAGQLLKPYQTIATHAVVADPACGAGDLLVAASGLLGIAPSIDDTMSLWARRLIGYDIHAEFVSATKLRLVLAAVRRGALPTRRTSLNNLLEKLTGIQVGDGVDGLRSQRHILSDALILANPPYGAARAPEDCAWASGKVSAAALFVDRLLDVAPAGVRLAMILPDVTRTGTRYRRWRLAVEKRAELRQINIVGLFDRWTDVDVFFAHLLKGQSPAAYLPQASWHRTPRTGPVIGDYFKVHTGPVVPHRDPELGDLHPYIFARLLTKCEEFETSQRSSRRYEGRTFTPPFVVVRRVSRPEDLHRATGTIIRGDKPVAVENHLLVLLPKLGGITTCRSLMRVLKLDSTNAWLNEVIRCRHLTVGALSSVPWGVDA